MKKNILLVLLFVVQAIYAVKAQTNCGNGKLSLYLDPINTSQNFLSNEIVSSKDLLNYTAEVSDYYLNDAKSKFFVLENITSTTLTNTVLKYTPHFNPASVKLYLTFDVINTSDASVLSTGNQPIFVDATGQALTATNLVAETSYLIKLPTLSPGYKIIFLEKVVSTSCISSTGMTMTVDLLEQKADNSFQTVCGTTGLVGGVQTTKLLTKYRQSLINNVIHSNLVKSPYCFEEGQNTQEFTYTYSFQHPEKTTSLSNFRVIFYPSGQGDGQDVSLIEWGNNFTINLVTTNSDGSTTIVDLKTITTLPFNALVLDKALVSCPAQQPAISFLKRLDLNLPKFNSNQKLVLTFKEYICCPKLFGPNSERGWGFQNQYNNECGLWTLTGDVGIEVDQTKNTVPPTYKPYTVGATSMILTSTISPPKITANRFPVNKLVGLENYTATVGMGPNARLYLNPYHNFDATKYSVVAVLRYENGMRYTQYDASNQPINGTQLDYIAWNNSLQGSINPFFPYHNFTFRDESNNEIMGTQLTSASTWYDYFTQNSTFANNYVFQYDNSVFNNTAVNDKIGLLVNKLSNATFNWSFEPDCQNAPSDHLPKYQLEFYLIPNVGTCKTCAIPLDKISKTIEIDCPGCKFTGGDVYVSSNQRMTLGTVDANNDGKQDSNTLIDPALNHDSNLANDYNLTTSMVGDIVQLRNVYYLTNGQDFPYTDANGVTKTVSMNDAIFGVNGLIHSYLEVNIPKGDSIQLYEDATYMAEVRLLDNSGNELSRVSNIDLIDESTNSYRDWIISNTKTSNSNKYIFDLSMARFVAGATTALPTAFHSGYVIDIRFYVKIAQNIKGGVDGKGISNNAISFRPYFSMVDYNSRDTRFKNGEFDQISGYTSDGDPYSIGSDGTKYTWTGFNSPSRLVNDLNNNIALNAHKLLLCGAGQTIMNTVAVYFGTYYGNPGAGTMWNTLISGTQCNNFVRYIGQVDIGKNTTQIFPREYRKSPAIGKFFFSIPAGSRLTRVDVAFGPNGQGADVNYVNQKYGAIAKNNTGDINFPHVALVKQNADFINYSINIDALNYTAGSTAVVPLIRGDEREQFTIVPYFETICTDNAISVPNKSILAVGPLNEPYWNRMELNQPAPYADQKYFSVNHPQTANGILQVPKPVALKTNNATAVYDKLGNINYPLILSNLNGGGQIIPNAFVVIQYDRSILTGVELYNATNQFISSFDILVSGTIYNRYFYNLNPTNNPGTSNIIAASTENNYTLKAAFVTCPDNNFRIYIGYGYSCTDVITASTNFSSLCNYTPPSQINSAVIFVKQAQLAIINQAYTNVVCGEMNYNYSIKSTNGIAKNLQSTITLPTGITVPDINTSVVQYGTRTLLSTEYSFVQSSTNSQEYDLTINDPILLDPDNVNLINVSIAMAYVQTCNINPANSIIQMTATGKSICGSSSSVQSGFTIGALQSCTTANILSGVITKTDGSATFICLDPTGIPAPTVLKVTTSNTALTYTYQWYVQTNNQYVSIAGATTNTYTTSETGWYKAEFTDIVTGCFGEAITHVIDNIPPPVNPFVCVGENPPLILNGLNGVSGSYTASWFTDAEPDVLVFNISQPGYYYAMAIIPGCTLRTATPVHVQFKETPNPYIFAGNSVVYHLNNDVNIAVANPTVNDLSSNTINWSQDANKHDLSPFTVNKDGKYTVRVTNNTTQCSVSSTVVVASPKIKLIQYGGNCGNANGVTLHAEANFAAGSYSWYKVNSVNPLSTTFISNGSDCFIPAPGGLYMVSNDLDQTCSGSIFYINLDNGINDPSNTTFTPSDLVPTTAGPNDGDFETIVSCVDAKDFQSTFDCQDQIPDFTIPGYEQNLIGHYIVTNSAGQWNSPAGNALWNGNALYNPNLTTTAAQQKFLIVDGEVGNGSQTVWSKTIDISQYPSMLQSFLFKASIRDIGVGAASASNKREIPEVSVNISFLTASGVSVQAASVAPVQVLYNSNNTQWIDLTTIVDRFNYYQGCEDPIIAEDFTQAKIEIVLIGGGAIGRDLGVDEIVFIPTKLCGGINGNATVNMSTSRLARTCNASLVKLMDDELHTCYGVPVTFALTTYTDTPLLTEWFDNSTYSGAPISTTKTLTVSPKSNATYYLRVTDATNNCYYTDQVTAYITQPEIHITSDVDNICIQPDVTFNVDNFTILGNIHYKWFKNATALTQGYDSRSLVLSNIQNDDIITCKLENQCKNADDSPLILISNEIKIKGRVSIADAGVDVTICSGATAAIGTAAVSGDIYVWSPALALADVSAAVSTASPVTTTVYTLKQTDINGCISTDDVTVRIEGAIPSVNAGLDKSICKGASTVPGPTVSGATVYTWSPATGVSDVHALAPTLAPVQATEYTLLGEDAFGCSASDMMTIVLLESPNVSLTSAGNLITTHVSGGQPPYQYSWFESATQINGVTTSTYTINTNGLYDVHVKDQNTCEGSAQINLVVSAVISANSIHGFIKIYPIPARNSVQIDYADEVLHIKNIKLFDVTGKEVMSAALDNQNGYLLDVSDLASGLYVMKLYCADGNEIISKVLVER